MPNRCLIMEPNKYYSLCDRTMDRRPPRCSKRLVNLVSRRRSSLAFQLGTQLACRLEGNSVILNRIPAALKVLPEVSMPSRPPFVRLQPVDVHLEHVPHSTYKRFPTCDHYSSRPASSVLRNRIQKAHPKHIKHHAQNLKRRFN